jgi:hypothetical protein
MVAFAPAQTEAGCRLALALGFDISRSVDERDYAIQRDGIVAALGAPEIRDALLKPGEDVALAVFEWSAGDEPVLVVPWTEIDGEAALADVSDRILRHVRSDDTLPTALGTAIDFGRRLLDAAPECQARTLDISGDGRSNFGLTPADVYARGGFADVLVNGLAIGGHESGIVGYYEREVIHGRGAFVEVAQTHNDFPPAIRRKLEKELTEQVIGRLRPGRDGRGDG